MGQLGTTVVTGRLGATVQDGADAGTALDKIWLDAGTVTFTPLVRFVTLPDDPDGPAQVRLENKVATVAADGTISIAVDEITDFVDPDGATHRVDYDAVSQARGVRAQFPAVYVRISGSTVDLAKVPASLPLDGSLGVQDVTLAKMSADRAEAAARRAEERVVEDLGTTDGQAATLINAPTSRTSAAVRSLVEAGVPPLVAQAIATDATVAQAAAAAAGPAVDAKVVDLDLAKLDTTGTLPPAQLPPALRTIAAEASTRFPAPALTANVNGNGEVFVDYDLVDVTGLLDEVSVFVRSNPGGLSSFGVRVMVGTLSSAAAGGVFTCRAASKVVTITGFAVGAASTVSGLRMQVQAGECVAIAVQSGINVGNTNGGGGSQGFGYTSAVASPLTRGPGSQTTIVQSFASPSAFGIGYRVVRYAAAEPVARADFQAFRGPVATALSSADVTRVPTVAAGSTSAVNGNGELFIDYAPAAHAGALDQLSVFVRTNPGSLATFQARVVVGTLSAQAAGGVFSPRAASPILTITAPTTGSQVTVSGFSVDVLAGEYVALQIQSGIGIGYAASGGVGFGYRFGVSSPFTVGPGSTTTIAQSFASPAVPGFGYRVSYINTAAVLRQGEVPVGLLPNPLFGKKIGGLGDSMMRGHSLADADTWLTKLASRNSMTRINYGINGTYLADVDYQGQKGAVVRYVDMADDLDYPVIFAGTNDAANAVPLGAVDSTSPTTFNGALNVLCVGLITKYPTKRPAFITPYRRNGNYPAYAEAIKARCAEHGIAVFDNVTRGGVDWTNNAQVAALTLNDTYHLSAAGMTYVVPKYEAFLRSL